MKENLRHILIPTLLSNFSGEFLKQKAVLKVLTMTDDKTKQKAIEAAADIYGIFGFFFCVYLSQAKALYILHFSIDLRVLGSY